MLKFGTLQPAQNTVCSNALIKKCGYSSNGTWASGRKVSSVAATKTRSDMVILDGTAKNETAAAMSKGMSGPVTIPTAGTSSQECHSKEVLANSKGTKRPKIKPLAQPNTKLVNMAENGDLIDINN
jgi:hypothetical protein